MATRIGTIFMEGRTDKDQSFLIKQSLLYDGHSLFMDDGGTRLTPAIWEVLRRPRGEESVDGVEGCAVDPMSAHITTTLPGRVKRLLHLDAKDSSVKPPVASE